MSLTCFKITINVTGVTGLLRGQSQARNTVKAFIHNTSSHLVTPVTGLCVCARVKKILLINLLSISNTKNIFSTCEELARNTRNTRNNHCFYYIFNFITCNKSVFTRNKLAFTRNNDLKNQQG